MAVMYVRGSGMTSEDRAREDTTVSAIKAETEIAFPDGETVIITPGLMTDGERLALDARIATWEKSGLLERKAKGTLSGQSLKDTRARYGPPKEWDHLQLSFDRNESEFLTSEQIDQARRTVLDVVGKDISGLHRKLTISRVHTDTGNTHIDAFVHRHAYNAAENAALPADELTGPSRLASVMEQINKRLRALNLPPMADVKKQDGRSLYEESATSDKAKTVLNEMVQDAGGLPTQRTGADPSDAALERLVRDTERDAKAAAQRWVDAQNALEAQRQRNELRTRVEQLESDVAQRNATIIERDQLIESERRAGTEALAAVEAQKVAVQEQLEQTQGQLEYMGSKFDQAARDRDEQRRRADELETDYTNAQEEINQQRTVITTLESDLGTITSERDAARRDLDVERKRVVDLEASLLAQRQAHEVAERQRAEQAKRADDAETEREALRQQLETERQARTTAEQARDKARSDTQQAQRATAAISEMLKSEKDDRNRDRTLFDVLKASLTDTITSLKEQLQGVKDALLGVTADRDKLRTERQDMADRVREALAESKKRGEKSKVDADTIAELRARLEAGGNNSGVDPKPPGKQ